MPFVPDSKFVPDTPQEKPPLSFGDIAKTFAYVLPKSAFNILGGSTLTLNDYLNKGAYEAGGKVTDLAAQSPVTRPIAPELGFAANVGIQTIPVIAGAAIGSKAAPAMEHEAKTLMGSALKPTRAEWESGAAKKAIDTMLKEGVSPTEGGVEVLKNKIADLNNQVKAAIAGSSETVKVGAPGKQLTDVLNQFTKQVAAQNDLASIRNVWAMYRNHPLLAGKEEMPIQVAQALKQGTYKQLGEKYYSGQIGTAQRDAEAAIARGLKEEIAAKVPGLQNLNTHESELLNALSIAERRALLNIGKNPGGLVWLYHNPAAAAGYLAAHSSTFKALFARMLHNTPELLPATAGGLAGGTYSAVNQDIARRNP